MKGMTRVLIIFFWVLLIAIVLYFPAFKASVQPFEDKSLNVFVWGDSLEISILAEFEKKTGIKVNLSFFSSNEELQVKMKATGGHGYDLILPSDYTVALLIKDQLLKPIDHSKLTFWDQIYPALLNHPFDQGNRFSIPYEWEIYGLAIDNEYFKNKPFENSWRAIFDPSVIDYKIAMKNDPIEAFQFAANYLFGPLDHVTKSQFNEIRSLLMEQRKWVVAYSDSRADYYIATGNCPLAISTLSHTKRIKRLFPNISFVIPKEGTFLTIENFCIPKASQKDDMVYKLLNHIFRKEALKTHYYNSWFFPALISAAKELDLTEEDQKLYEFTREDIERFQFFKNIVSQQKVRDLWVEVKSF